MPINELIYLFINKRNMLRRELDNSFCFRENNSKRGKALMANRLTSAKDLFRGQFLLTVFIDRFYWPFLRTVIVNKKEEIYFILWETILLKSVKNAKNAKKLFFL